MELEFNIPAKCFRYFLLSTHKLTCLRKAKPYLNVFKFTVSYTTSYFQEQVYLAPYLKVLVYNPSEDSGHTILRPGGNPRSIKMKQV